MANQLGVVMQNNIIRLHAAGLSNRQIAKDLGINRKTVNRYVRAYHKLKEQKGPEVASGSENVQNGPPLSTGIPDMQKAIIVFPPKKRSNNQISLCEPYRDFIEEAYLKGLSAVRIYQDLLS